MGKYSKKVKPDRNNLDKEWLRQPDLIQDYIEKQALAEEKVDRAKLKLDVVKAQVELDIRKNPADYELTKATDLTVQAAVNCHDEVIAAREAVIEAKKNYGIIKSAVEGLQHKKQALSELVILHGRGYYAEPHVKSDEGEHIDHSRVATRRAARRRTQRNKDDE